MTKITQWLEKIKNKIFLERNKEKFIKELIKKDGDFEILYNYNTELFKEKLKEIIIENCFYQQIGMVKDAIDSEITIIDTMIDQTSGGKENEQEIVKNLKIKNAFCKILNEEKKHNFVKAISYSNYQGKFMLRVNLYVNEKTYFEYDFFINKEFVEDYVKNYAGVKI